MIEAHDRDGGPAFELYALGLEHKHVAETQLYSGLTRRPIFVPSVGHFRQGMLVSVPLHLDDLPGRPRGADLHDALAAFYDGLRLCARRRAGGRRQARTAGAQRHEPPRTARLRQRERRHAVLVARLDNLGKGASGAAVQNLSLMLGLERA